MNTEQPNSKNDIMQNQEEAMHHLVKATNKLDESNRKVSKEYTEEVRLEVKGESKGKTESIEKLDNRLEHLEANLKKIAENQQKIIEQFQKGHEQREEEASKSETEDEEENLEKYACDICGNIYEDKRGMAAHLNMTHGLSGEGVVDKNIREPKTHELDQEERKELDNEDDYRCPYCDQIVSKHALSRHISSQHEEKTGLRDFFWDEQKEAYCYREEGIEESEWQLLRNKFGKFDYTTTDVFIQALEKGFNSEQEMYEKTQKSNEDKEVQAEKSKEETQDNISDYEKAKRKASVSDRDMEIAEQAIHKIIHDHLDNIPDSNEKFISYSGNENIPGFETLYAGDLGALNMWRKIFSNTGLLTGINERAGQNHDLTWERKGTSGTPKNWVIKVERTDR